ncbi:MAG: LytTR family DNA-binding domain-containing protein [Burkholderiaceae bacterium]|nr:LytTR family DNA-binding domain-containing protein [Burkholderiaceae bacterium]
MSGAVNAWRVLIVDDEALARSRLATLVAECADPRCTVAGQCASTQQARQWLSEYQADIVLLDIQMPGQPGTVLAAELQRMGRPPAVVFVTAHTEHALAAFDLDAADYLTKPVKRERLAAALERAARRVPAAPGSGAAAQDQAVLVVSERGRVARIPLAEVLYLKAELKYVTLRTAGRTWVLDDSLTELEQRLGERFLRLHRNALVARDAVRLLERRRMAEHDDDAGGNEIGWAVQVAPVGEWLAVSRRQLGAVREALAPGG